MSEGLTLRRESIQSLYRQMAWLLSPCEQAEKAMVQHGLVPASPEVADLEHANSHAVLNGIRPILGPLSLAGQLASSVVTDLRLVNHDVDDEDVEEDRVFLNSVITQSIMSSVAFLLDLGILELGNTGISVE